jgi:cholesterol transport system auxiliary component
MRSFLIATCLTASLAGCGALTAVSDASKPLNAYTLAPLAPAGARTGQGHLVVPVPSASGAIATDRILVKPNRLQAEYLPDGRWVDPAPVLVQSLLVSSLQGSGRFRLVGRDDAGLIPDLSLLVDLTDFQAETPSVAGQPWTVRVGMVASVVREEDRSIAASRRFDSVVQATSDAPIAIVAAFDAATTQVLAQVREWVQAQAR